MLEPEGSLPEIYVQPGEAHIVTQPSILKTLLGSCVGITFWAPQHGLAALCHPMLPQCPVGRLGRITTTACLRYVDYAIHDLARKFDACGAQRGQVHVKLFGGCDVLPDARQSLRPTIGRLNSEAAMKVLDTEGFRVCTSCLGGNSGITILFNTRNGEVLLKRLCQAHGTDVARRAEDSWEAAPTRTSKG